MFHAFHAFTIRDSPALRAEIGSNARHKVEADNLWDCLLTLANSAPEQKCRGLVSLRL